MNLRYYFDGFLLALHLGGFLWMAATIFDNQAFHQAVLFLLFSDLWWLIYERNTWPRPCLLACQLYQKLRKQNGMPWSQLTLTHDYLDTYAPRTWTWTNALAGALLTFGAPVVETSPLARPESAFLALVLICAANTIIDIVRTQLTMDPSYTQS